MPAYDVTRFKATHNSYSGGLRGSLRSQLDRQVRFLELDIHNSGYSEIGDFRVGHLKPGSEVATGSGNPDTLLVRDWLQTITGWSNDNARHAPISIVFDAKGDLSEGGGDLADLNDTVKSVFGPRLFTRLDYDGAGTWPDIERLRGRILCILSGDGGTRASYRWTFASSPAIAINAGGDTVLTYVSPSGDVRAWVGRTDAADLRITWRRKATYAFSAAGLSDPCIAINDAGWIVAVSSFRRPGIPEPMLASVVGLLQDDGRIRWHDSRPFARGVQPTIQMDEDEVREIHTMADGRRRQQVRGTLDRKKHRVEWQSPRVGPADPFARDTVLWEGHEVRAALDAEGLLGCSVDRGEAQPVRFNQLLFVEEQKGDPAELIRDARFFAASAKETTAIASARGRGLVARAWGFEETDAEVAATPPFENVPATDTPAIAWYDTYMTAPEVAV